MQVASGSFKEHPEFAGKEEPWQHCSLAGFTFLVEDPSLCNSFLVKQEYR